MEGRGTDCPPAFGNPAQHVWGAAIGEVEQTGEDEGGGGGVGQGADL